MTPLNISDEEIERFLSEIVKPEYKIERMLKYRSFRDMIELVAICIKKNGYISSDDVVNKFGVLPEWSKKKLIRFVNLELLVKISDTEFQAVLDEKGEPKIYKCYDRSKKWERIW